MKCLPRNGNAPDKYCDLENFSDIKKFRQSFNIPDKPQPGELPFLMAAVLAVQVFDLYHQMSPTAKKASMTKKVFGTTAYKKAYNLRKELGLD